jgi:hypothetical protein
MDRAQEIKSDAVTFLGTLRMACGPAADRFVPPPDAVAAAATARRIERFIDSYQ